MSNSTKPPCFIEGCEKPSVAMKGGPCQMHKMRLHRTGSFHVQRPIDERPDEEWRPIPSLENRYEASSHGRIRWAGPTVGSTYTGRIVGASLNAYGYLIMKPYPRPDRRDVGVHQLVSWAFHGPCPEGFEVNHKDGDRTNNKPENLEYLTHADNVRHSWEVLGRESQKGADHGMSKVSEDDVKAIRARAAAGETIASIAKDYPINNWSVGAIIRRVTWKHI